jgi:hypothetical protein
VNYFRCQARCQAVLIASHVQLARLRDSVVLLVPRSARRSAKKLNGAVFCGVQR